MEITEIKRISNAGRGRPGEPRPLLNEEGNLEGDAPDIPVPELRRLYENAAYVRAVEAGLSEAWQAGHIGFHPTSQDTAYAVLCATAALGSEPWVFPTWRDFGALFQRGVSVEDYVRQVTGHTGSAGRAAPGFFTDRSHRIVSVGAPTQGHLTQAVGLAWAGRTYGEVAAAFLSDAAVDAAEFHHAVNFAGVFKAPVIFLCLTRGEREPPVSARGESYGVEATRCNGDDPFSVFGEVRAALTRAREHAPTLLELVVTDDLPEARVRRYLERRGEWSDAQESALQRQVAVEVDRPLKTPATREMPRAEGFDHVFRGGAPFLTEQRDNH